MKLTQIKVSRTQAMKPWPSPKQKSSMSSWTASRGNTDQSSPGTTSTAWTKRLKKCATLCKSAMPTTRPPWTRCSPRRTSSKERSPASTNQLAQWLPVRDGAESCRSQKLFNEIAQWTPRFDKWSADCTVLHYLHVLLSYRSTIPIIGGKFMQDVQRVVKENNPAQDWRNLAEGLWAVALSYKKSTKLNVDHLSMGYVKPFSELNAHSSNNLFVFCPSYPKKVIYLHHQKYDRIKWINPNISIQDLN